MLAILLRRSGIANAPPSPAAALLAGRALAAAAWPPPPPPTGDAVLLQGLVFHGHHGVLPEERALGQKFVVDAALSASLAAAGRADDLGQTVDYAAVYESIRTRVEGRPRQLLEALAEDIAASILEEQPRVAAVRVRVTKPHVAVRGALAGLGVEIVRRRGGGGGGE